jgi:uncharacterized membrane protein
MQFTAVKPHFIAKHLAWPGYTATLPSMQLTPVIAIHIASAVSAIVIGPFAIWARKGAVQRPKLHRALGYAWVTLMIATALSAVCIRDYQLPNIAGYTPIHLFVPFTLFGLIGAFRALALGNITQHRQRMIGVYVGACLVAGAFTLMPQRYLGQLIWHHWLGFI